MQVVALAGASTQTQSNELAIETNLVKMPTANVEMIAQFFLRNGAQLSPKVWSLQSTVLSRAWNGLILLKPRSGVSHSHSTNAEQWYTFINQKNRRRWARSRPGTCTRPWKLRLWWAWDLLLPWCWQCRPPKCRWRCVVCKCGCMYIPLTGELAQSTQHFSRQEHILIKELCVVLRRVCCDMCNVYRYVAFAQATVSMCIMYWTVVWSYDACNLHKYVASQMLL